MLAGIEQHEARVGIHHFQPFQAIAPARVITARQMPDRPVLEEDVDLHVRPAILLAVGPILLRPAFEKRLHFRHIGREIPHHVKRMRMHGRMWKQGELSLGLLIHMVMLTMLISPQPRPDRPILLPQRRRGEAMIQVDAVAQVSCPSRARPSPSPCDSLEIGFSPRSECPRSAVPSSACNDRRRSRCPRCTCWRRRSGCRSPAFP